MALLPPVIVELKANATELMSKLGEVQSKVEETATKGASHFDKLKAAIGPATLAVGATVTAAAALAEHLGQPLEQSRKQLEATLDTLGTSMEEYRDEVGKADDQMRNFGHSQSDTETALRKLVTATQDPTKALGDMALVANIAAAKHISLADASDLLVKGLAGSTRVFKQFGIDVQKNKDGTLDLNSAMEQLSKRLEGQAAASVDTFGGKIEVIKTKIEDWVGVHAQKLIPILTVTGPVLMGVGSIITSGVVPAIGKAVVAMGEMIVKTVVWAATTVAEAAVAVASWVASMAVMAASAIAAGIAMLLPFLPVILILAAVGAAAYLLYRNWDTVFGFIKDIVRDAFEWVKKHLDLIVEIAFGPLGIALVLLKNHWEEVWGGIKAVVAEVWDFIRPIFESIKRGVDDVVGAVSKVEGIAGAVSGGALSTAKKLFFGASGGIVTRPTLGLIGEAGPEAVIPLNQAPGASPLGGGGGGTTIVLQLPPGLIIGTAQQVADMLGPHIANALNKGARRGVDYTTAFGLS